MHKIYLSLGSNLGNRRENLFCAIKHLDESLGKHLKLSSFIETKSWGYQGKDYLNCAVLYETDLLPHTLLKLCKKIEEKMGRILNLEYDEAGNRVYKDRVIDIDILLYGNQKVNSPELKIPHPLMDKREFVLVPLREILPSYEGREDTY